MASRYGQETCWRARQAVDLGTGRNVRSEELDAETMGMPPENRADDAYDAFKVHWNAELKLRDTSDGEKKPSLVRALRKAFGTYYFLGGLCKCGWSAFVITGAFFFVRRCVRAAGLPR